MKKKKNKTKKLITTITKGHDVEELAEEEELVMDGYYVQLPTDQSRIDEAHLNLEQD